MAAKKFENRHDAGHFVIDPQHLAEGLKAAKQGKHAAVRVAPLMPRDKGLSFDVSALHGQSWIRQLTLDPDLTPASEGLEDILSQLDGLVELTLREWAPLDFSRFKKLKALTLTHGTALKGVDKIALRSLYLIEWQGAELPQNVASSHIAELRIGVARKLTTLATVFKMSSLSELNLQDLPRLAPVTTAVKLASIVALHVENVAWTDFSWLHSSSLRELELWTRVGSLRFIAQLKQLRKLYIWECLDGDMTPILEHPTLTEIYLDKNRKHYSHKEAQLQAALQAR